MYLLHVPQHILPAVKDSSTLLRIQLVDEVGGVVFVRVLVPSNKTRLGQCFFYLLCS